MLFGLIRSTETIKTQGKKRSSRWPYFVKKLVAAHPYCSACGATSDLVGHHRKSFHEFPELELDPQNIVILCESRGKRDCHFLLGHLGVSWEVTNPKVVELADLLLSEIKKARNNNDIPIRFKMHRNEWNSWRAMWSRCTDSKYKKYHLYGGRGIRVCERWVDFALFLEDMGSKPTPKHSIERKNGNGDYCPDNCIWATHTEQCRNTSRNRYVTAFGKTQCCSAWAEETGIKKDVIYKRIINGWDVERALTETAREAKIIRIEYQGRTETVLAWSKILKINYTTIKQRLSKNWSLDKVFAKTKSVKG